MRTLALQEAADFLKIHPVTLRVKAAAGEIPGAKPGKCWVFLDDDLTSYIRSKYSVRASQGDTLEKMICHSTNVRTLPIGGLSFPSWEERYNAALEQTIN
jgi:hypothetical protein